MDMQNKLQNLYNTLCQIETKGNSTLIMGDCLKFLHQCIQECNAPQSEATEPEKVA